MIIDQKVFPAPIVIAEILSVARFQRYLDTGEHPSDEYSKTWDMLAWLDAHKKTNQPTNL